MNRPTLAKLTFALTVALGLASVPARAEGVPSDYLAIEWKLVSIDGAPFAATATIDLSQPGKISGQGPCNRFFGSYDGTLPEFRPTGIASTKMACPDMAAEALMFTALSAVSKAEVTGPVTLVLTGPDGRTMEFARPLN